MYTYKSFETLGVFTLFRPVFVTILIVSLILFFGLVTPKFTKVVNSFTVLVLSVTSTLVSGMLLFYNGIIVDELGLAGDPISFYLFVTILGLSAISLIYYFIGKKRLTKKVRELDMDLKEHLKK